MAHELLNWTGAPRYTEYVVSYTSPVGYTASFLWVRRADANQLEEMLAEIERDTARHGWTNISFRKATH